MTGRGQNKMFRKGVLDEEERTRCGGECSVAPGGYIAVGTRGFVGQTAFAFQRSIDY